MPLLPSPTIQKLTVKEVLNSVLNTGEDALKVDIDNATISTGALEINLDNANDDVLTYGYDGSANQKLKVDSSGHLQVDVLSQIGGGAGEEFADGAAVGGSNKGRLVLGTDGSNYQVLSTHTDGTLKIKSIADAVSIADGGNVISVDDGGGALTVDGTVTVQDGGGVISVDDGAGSLTVDGTVTVVQGSAGSLNVTTANEGDILTKATTIAGAVASGQMQVDVVAALPTGTNTVGKVKLTDGSEDVAINGSNQLEVNVNTASGLEVVQTTAADFNVTEASASGIKTDLDQMLWSVGLEVSANDSADLSGAPYYGVWVGTGGNVRLNTGASAGGSDLTFNNVASGQLIPIKVYRVYSTSTTASNVLVLK